MISLKTFILQIWVTWASKITIKNFQLCSIKIKEATPPVTSHATALYESYLQDIQANEAHITDVNTLAKKLLNERHPDSALIQTRQEAVNESWRDLRAVAKHREERLAGAHEIQKFNRL